MKERPILFSAPMVRAILDGRKTQTRRAVKKQESYAHWSCATRVFDSEYLKQFLPGADQGSWVLQEHPGELVDLKWQPIGCPKGIPGECLWVRETIRATQDGLKFGIHYLADGAVSWLGREHDEQWISMYDYRGAAGATIPSIHMHRWASRINLEITSLRVERLSDISATDAIAEGAQRTADGGAWHIENEQHRSADPRDTFASLWESINGAGSWEQNPWVWVIEFKRTQEAA